MKEHTQVQTDGRDIQGKVCGKGHEAFMPSPHTSTRSQTQQLSEPCPFGFLWRLHYTDMIE